MECREIRISSCTSLHSPNRQYRVVFRPYFIGRNTQLIPSCQCRETKHGNSDFRRRKRHSSRNIRTVEKRTYLQYYRLLRVRYIRNYTISYGNRLSQIICSGILSRMEHCQCSYPAFLPNEQQIRGLSESHR